MPIADTSATFLHGLSDLWLRFFKDKNQLAAMYKGTENLIGQAYLDLLDTVLNLSLRNTPAFNKEYFKLLTIRQDQLVYVGATDRWTFNLPSNVKNFSLLCNKVLDPSVMLQADIDFEIDLLGTQDELRFYVDPFTSGTGGGPIDGVAHRTVQIDDPAGGVVPIDVLELAFWVPNVEIDRGNMYLIYGQLLNYYSPSSEAYKALLKGIMQYFVLGPSLTHIVSTLNVCSGLPVVREDGEILQSVDLSGVSSNIVITDKYDYVLPKSVPIRLDILDTANWTTLTLDAYSVLTTVFTVSDAITDPTWWYDANVPAKLTYDPLTQYSEPLVRRQITPVMYEALINNPPGLVHIGDPGFYIGADEDGYVPTTRGGYHHLFAYVIFQRYLQNHIFAIVYDNTLMQQMGLPFPIWDTNFSNIIIAGKPSYVMMYSEPSIEFLDVVPPPLDDSAIPHNPLLAGLDILVKVGAPPNLPTPPYDPWDEVTREPNELLIGGAWSVGDYYWYEPLGTIGIANEIAGPPDPATGDTNICVGGSDPYVMPPATSLAPYDSRMMDWPVEITIH